MGTNGLPHSGISQKKAPELNPAQKAIIQSAIDAHNKKYENDKSRQIDASDVFTIAKNEKGVITVQIDAYGFKDGKVTQAADGQYDLQLQFKDESFSANKDYAFETREDSSDKLGDYVNKRDQYSKKLDQDYVEFTGEDDSRLKNIEKLNDKFNKDKLINVGYWRDANPDVNLEKDFDKNIANLKAKLKLIKDKDTVINEHSNFLTDDEIDDLRVSTNPKKEAKEIRKRIVEELETAIKDLEQMKEDLDAEKADAQKEIGKLNKDMEKAGVSKDVLKGLNNGKSVEKAYDDADTHGTGRDYEKADINKNLGTSYAMTRPDKMKDVPFDYSSLSGIFQTKVSQDLTKATVESTINKYNEANPTKPISFDDVAAITINPDNGDIVIAMKDGSDGKGNKIDDGHYDYKISGFYNKKSGVLNTSGDFKLESYGYKSTAGIEALKADLKASVASLQHLTGDLAKAKSKEIAKLVDLLKNADVPDSEINKIKAEGQGIIVGMPGKENPPPPISAPKEVSAPVNTPKSLDDVQPLDESVAMSMSSAQKSETVRDIVMQYLCTPQEAAEKLGIGDDAPDSAIYADMSPEDKEKLVNAYAKKYNMTPQQAAEKLGMPPREQK